MSSSRIMETNGHIQQTFDFNLELPLAAKEDIIALFHNHVAQHPHDEAVCSHDGILTYGELGTLVARLSAYLTVHGVKSETIVSLLFEKSLWAVVAALGVLNAGGAFLFLDPSQPQARLKSIHGQSGASLGLSSEPAVSLCRSLLSQTAAVNADFLSALPDTRDTPTTTKPQDAAYLIFTSGSTGTPKGVVIERSQLSTTTSYVGKLLGYKRGTRVFQFAAYSFDACITDIFATLAHGGTVCIPSEWERNNDIIGAMRRMRVTSAKFTPSLAGNLGFDSLSSLNTVILGGESSPLPLVRSLVSKFKVILVYGPSECCVICFVNHVSGGHLVPGDLGRPVGARAWVVKHGDHNRLADVGEIGELLMEGPNVGRGYLGDRDLTTTRFIQSPLWATTRTEVEQGCWYLTGDLCRYLEDGTICYIGRADNQVKIRGQRLELEEVEKKIYECIPDIDGIEAAQVVVDAEIPSGLTSKQLVAFLSLSTTRPVGDLILGEDDSVVRRTTAEQQDNFAAVVEQLEGALSNFLPAYAIPSIWIPMSRLPLTASRKPDRKRLRSIVAGSTVMDLASFHKEIDNIPTMPSSGEPSETEVILRELWAEVFGMKPTDIPPQAGFFQLGGDSVMAIKLISMARGRFLDLTLDIVFQHPSLSEMARVTGHLAPNDDSIVDIPPFALIGNHDAALLKQEASKQCGVPEQCIEDIYPCSHMQEGLLALSLKDPGTYILQFVYQMPSAVNLERLKHAWEVVASRARTMRTRFFDYSAEVFQVVIDEELSWDFIEGDLAAVLLRAKAIQFEFGKRMSHHTVVVHTTGQYYLVWTVHHALVDGWSESDIITWVEDEYYGNSRGERRVPGYNRFIKHVIQRDHASSRAFWKKRLAGVAAPTFPPLPDPSYVPKVQRSNRILHHLDTADDAELEHRTSALKHSSATTATLIQAAWFVLIGAYSKTIDVVTGVTLNGRTVPVPGIDLIPGPTISTIPFRVHISPVQTVQTLLERVQQEYLSILPHAHYGLHHMRQLGEGAVAACNFRTLLVVQSSNRAQTTRKLLSGRSYSFPVMDFAIVMECEIIQGNIEFRATFDKQVVGEEQVSQMLVDMERTLNAIATSGPSAMVSDLPTIDAFSIPHPSEPSTIPDSIGPASTLAEHNIIPPSTPRQRCLHRIWQTLLETDNFGIDDDFFALGGGSVLAMRLVSLARREGLILTVAGVFKKPTIRNLALTALDSEAPDNLAPFSLLRPEDVKPFRKLAAQQCEVPVDEVEDIYPCTRMQLHYVTGYPEANKVPSEPWDWQSQAVWSLPREVDVERFKAAWGIVIRRHPALRTRLVRRANQIIQAVIKGSGRFEWEELSDLERHLREDRCRQMTFGHRLLRLAIVHPKETGPIHFVMTIHHTVYDAFARSMMFKEVEHIYFRDSSALIPPGRMNTFVKYMLEADKNNAGDFWSEYLSNVATQPLLAIPEGVRVLHQVERTVTTKTPNTDGVQATLPTIIEVACALTIAAKLGCRDVIFYSDRAGRNLPIHGIQDLVGPTTLFLPLRITVDSSQPVSELLANVQESKAAMLPYEHLGWLELREMHHLRDALKHSINLNINPQGFDTMGQRLRIKFEGSHVTFDDPFGINVDLYDDRIEWTVYYDERFIGVDDVSWLLFHLHQHDPSYAHPSNTTCIKYISIETHKHINNPCYFHRYYHPHPYDGVPGSRPDDARGQRVGADTTVAAIRRVIQPTDCNSVRDSDSDSDSAGNRNGDNNTTTARNATTTDYPRPRPARRRVRRRTRSETSRIKLEKKTEQKKIREAYKAERQALHKQAIEEAVSQEKKPAQVRVIFYRRTAERACNKKIAAVEGESATKEREARRKHLEGIRENYRMRSRAWQQQAIAQQQGQQNKEQQQQKYEKEREELAPQRRAELIPKRDRKVAGLRLEKKNQKQELRITCKQDRRALHERARAEVSARGKKATWARVFVAEYGTHGLEAELTRTDKSAELDRETGAKVREVWSEYWEGLRILDKMLAED